MQWYCVHTRPKKEELVVEYCRNMLGLQAYLPIIRQYRTIRRVRRLVSSPLFPRYFFCQFDATNYRQVRFAPEALDVVHFGSQPAIVSPTLIRELQDWESTAGTIATEETFRPGDRAQIVDGPMRGLSAVILRAGDDQERVAILLSILDGEARATISRHELRRVS